MLCPGSGRPIGRILVLPGARIVCEVCGQECTASSPTLKEQRAGVQLKYSPHPKKSSAEPDRR
jgi:hypothetical protein